MKHPVVDGDCVDLKSTDSHRKAGATFSKNLSGKTSFPAGFFTPTGGTDFPDRRKKNLKMQSGKKSDPSRLDWNKSLGAKYRYRFWMIRKLGEIPNNQSFNIGGRFLKNLSHATYEGSCRLLLGGRKTFPASGFNSPVGCYFQGLVAQWIIGSLILHANQAED